MTVEAPSKAEQIADRLVEEGVVLPEFRDEVLTTIQKELRKRTRSIAAGFARLAERSITGRRVSRAITSV